MDLWDPRSNDLQKQGFLMPLHSLTNLEIQKYYQNKPRFNEVYSRDSLSNKIKYEAYVINLNEYAYVGTHWIALYPLNNITYFDSFGVNTFQNKLKSSSMDL